MSDNTKGAALDERALFEAQARAAGYSDKEIAMQSKGCYLVAGLGSGWRFWQARATIDQSTASAPTQQAAPEAPATTASADGSLINEGTSRAAGTAGGDISQSAPVSAPTDGAAQSEKAAAANAGGRVLMDQWNAGAAMLLALDALDVAATPLPEDRQKVLKAQAALRAAIKADRAAATSAGGKV